MINILTTGYAGRTASEMNGLAIINEGVVVDVRLKAFSYNPEFSKRHLKEALQDRYVHAPALGNLNYRQPENGVQIADMEAGIRQIRALEAAGHKTAILMCACKSGKRCHRAQIAAQLRELGYQVDEIHQA